MKFSLVLLCLLGLACSPPQPSGAAQTSTGLDSLNAHLVQAYRSHDPQAYAALFTDTAVFEWPAFPSVQGPAALAQMAQSNWASLSDMDLRLSVSRRHLAPDHATEFGTFEQSWSDSSGVRWTEYGRYASLLLQQADGSWRMDRFLGFEDSTQQRPPAHP